MQISVLWAVLWTAAVVLAFFLYFRSKAKADLRYTFGIRKQVINDYVDISGYTRKGWSLDRCAQEIDDAYDIAGKVFERARKEAEKELEEKKKSYREKEHASART